MITILGRPNSSNSQKVFWLLDELELPFTLELAGMEHGRNKTPDYLAMNPNGLVPTLVEGDFVLWESNSVMRYLSAKHGKGRHAPHSLEDRMRGERWLDWQLTTLNPAVTPVFWTLIRTKPEARDPAKLTEAVAKANTVMSILDRALGQAPYLGGAEFSLYDIPAGIQAYRYFTLPIERAKLPHLEDWYNRLAARPAFQKRIMIGLS